MESEEPDFAHRLGALTLRTACTPPKPKFQGLKTQHCCVFLTPRSTPLFHAPITKGAHKGRLWLLECVEENGGGLFGRRGPLGSARLCGEERNPSDTFNAELIPRSLNLGQEKCKSLKMLSKITHFKASCTPLHKSLFQSPGQCA